MSRVGWIVFLFILVGGGLLTSPASALVHFDFDQKYFVHPHRQVWDFSIVRPDSVYHIYYHTIHEETPQASYADTIWHATSENLKQWVIEDPILTVGQGSWDAGALWAPDIFYDHTQDRWALAYTACDLQMNQRIALAFSDDLYNWTKSPTNPAVEPDPALYMWDENEWWSDFRDPYVFLLDGTFHLLVTAKQWLSDSVGVIYHGVSLDLETWFDVGPIFYNDGIDPWRVLESPQMHFLDGRGYYLLFGEYDTGGISAISSPFPGGWSMDDRIWIDYGYAPEVDEFDAGIPIFSRITPYEPPATGLRSYVVRLDTLQVNTDGTIEPYQPNPLAEKWASWSGASNLAQPTFGDNPAFRGQPSVGLRGNGFYGSQEYYQGPLSGRGSPGTILGDAATGTLDSKIFTITGSRMTLLVGGGNYPETCYVALMDAQADTIIYSETGNNQEMMTERQWNLAPYRGRDAYIRIVDQESQSFGHINVDDIKEDFLDVSPVPQSGLPNARLLDHHAFPNPFNPRTSISFNLAADSPVVMKVHDLRGHLVWSSGSFQGRAGTNSLEWDGTGEDGSNLPAGTYLYGLEVGGQLAGSGKISLVK